MTYPLNHEHKTHSLSVLFIDSSVDHLHHLIKGMTLNIPVHILSDDRDGVEQIYETLKTYRNHARITTVYVVAHGSPGCLYIGNHELSLNTLKAHTPQLSELFQPSQVKSDSAYLYPQIHLYGCSVAAGDAGEEFVQKLANITGADIAASKHPLGHTALGGAWQWDTTTGGLEKPPIIFSEETRSQWFGLLEPEDIPLVFAGQPTTLNGAGICERSLVHTADVIRVSRVATTFDGVVIDGLIRAIDTGTGMAYDPTIGELSCHSSGSELLDGLLRVNLQFVETGTDVEVCLPNLTAQFWDIDSNSSAETAEVVGFSNADSMNLVELSADDDLEAHGSFNNNKLTYQLRDQSVENALDASANWTNNWKEKDSNHDNIFDSANNRDRNSSIERSRSALLDGAHLDYRVTAKFQQFTSTDIAYGITRSLCATAVVCGLRLSALKLTKSDSAPIRSRKLQQAAYKQHSSSQHSSHQQSKENSPIYVTTEDALSILFVDRHVQDYDQIVASTRASTSVHTLNEHAGGIEQVTRLLRDRYSTRSIQSIHIVARSVPGSLYLGTSVLNTDTFKRYRRLISTWRAQTLYLHSTYTAEQSADKSLVYQFEDLLGIPVLELPSQLVGAYLGNCAQGASHPFSLRCSPRLDDALAHRLVS